MNLVVRGDGQNVAVAQLDVQKKCLRNEDGQQGRAVSDGWICLHRGSRVLTGDHSEPLPLVVAERTETHMA